MTTVATMVTNIINDSGRSDTSLSDVVLVDIKSSIRDYEAERFYFNEQGLAITLSATDTYALALFAAAGTGVADIIEVDGINLIVGTRSYDLTEKSFSEISAKQNNGVTGNPTDYAIFNQSVIVFPKPTTMLSAIMAAHVKFTEITAFTDTNPWTNDASELIRNAAEKRLWARRWKNPDNANAAANLEQSAYLALKRRTDALSGDSVEGYL